MKYISYFFISFFLAHSVYAERFADSLDTIITEKTAVLSRDFRDIKNIVYKINGRLKKCVTFQDMQEFLYTDNSVATLFIEKMQVKNSSIPALVLEQFEKDLQDLSVALGAKLYLYYLECCKQKMLYKAVENYNALNYWQHEKFLEQLPFYNKAFSRWFTTQNYHNKVAENLEHLTGIEELVYGFLGLVCQNETLLLQAKTQEDFIEQMKAGALRQHDFLYHNKKNIYHNQDIANILRLSLAQVCQFSKDIEFHYAHCQLPSYLERHWEFYTTLAVLLAASGFVYQKYGTDITEGAGYFWKEHVQGAVDRTVKTFWQGVEGPQLDISGDKQDAEAMMNQLLARCEPRSGGNPFIALLDDLNTHSDGVAEQVMDELKDKRAIYWGKSFSDAAYNMWYLLTTKFEDIGKDLAEKAEKTKEIKFNRSLAKQERDRILNLSFEEKKQLVQERIRIIKAHKGLNIFDVPDAYALEGEFKKIEAQELLNKYFKDIHMTFSLIALIPIAMVASASLFASKRVYKNVAYQPLRSFTRHLEVLLNSCASQPVSFKIDGKLYFLSEQLRLHVPVLTLQEQRLMQDDIADLQSSYLNYQQKLNVIQRMYRTYLWLAPVETI